MFTFDPDTNPYADDLMRLGMAPRGRYADVERRALGRIIASKLYKLILEAPFETDAGYSSWKSTDQVSVEIEVVFDADADLVVEREHAGRDGYQTGLIVLYVSDRGVQEVFNGILDGFYSKDIKNRLEQARAGETGNGAGTDGGVARRSDGEATGVYSGRGGNGSRGNDGGNGDGGDGGGNAGDAGGPGNTPGGRGVGELIDHPVLFSVERQVFDAILAHI